MTPQGMLGNALGAPAANSNLYNQVAGMGANSAPAPDNSQQQPQMESLVEKATKRFGAVFQSFTDLLESYPGSDKEAQMAKDALANWFNSAVNKINESGGNSTY